MESFAKEVEAIFQERILSQVVEYYNSTYGLTSSTDELVKALKMSKPAKPARTTSVKVKTTKTSKPAEETGELVEFEGQYSALADGTCRYCRGEKMCGKELTENQILFCSDHRGYKPSTYKTNMKKKIIPTLQSNGVEVPEELINAKSSRGGVKRAKPDKKEINVLTNKLKKPTKGISDLLVSKPKGGFVRSKKHGLYLSSSLGLAGRKEGGKVIITSLYDVDNDEVLPLTDEAIDVANESGLEVEHDALDDGEDDEGEEMYN